MKRLILAALLLSLASAGAEQPKEKNGPSSTSVPAVVDKLKKDYGVIDPSPGKGDVNGLGGYVQLQQRFYPQAFVSGTFYDWRTTSVYRRNAGLHLGYDVAMPYGTPFSAGWSGTVVSIAHWYGPQYGITVQMTNGWTVTYGHVSPSVSVGQVVAPGDVMGTIALDHVDIKMRDAAGNYVAFGEGAVIPNSPYAGLANNSTEAFLVTWLVSKNSLEESDSDLAMRKVERVRLKADAKTLKSRVPELEKTLKQMQEYAEQGLVARKEVEEARQELANTKKRAKNIGPALAANERALNLLESQRAAAASRLASIESQAKGRGLTWKHVEGMVNRIVAKSPTLTEEVQHFKKDVTEGKSTKLAQLKKKAEDGRVQLEKLEELYEMGGLPKVEIEAARARQKALENELKSI